MTKDRTFLQLMLSAATVLLMLTGCNNDLKDDVDDLKNRVTTIEESVSLLEQAIMNGKMIASVAPVAASGTNPGGWLITFSDKTTITINNGTKGDKGDKGDQGLTPYIWVNASGNWASNLGSKPADSDNPRYEIKVGSDNQSVKANGVSVRVVNKDGYVAFEEYDEVTNTVLRTIPTTFPFVGGKVITAIAETPESVTFTIDGKSYSLPKAAVYPTSITVIRDKEYIVKGGTVEFNIAVNPASNKIYAKESFELDYEMKYTRAYGVTPNFIKIKDVQPDATITGQYKMTLEWTASMAEFAKDAAIFIVLNCKDAKGTLTQVVSSTPLIMNEKYVSIKAENVLNMDDIVMFTDETFTDSVRLSNYHEGYVNTVSHALTANPALAPIAINPLERFLSSDGDKYKFRVVPYLASNTTVWPNGIFVRQVNVRTSVVDYGRAQVDEVPAKPEIGQPAIPAIPAIAARTINKDFSVTVYRVPTNKVIYEKDFQDRWLPNTTVDYTLTETLKTVFANNGYSDAYWDFAITKQDLQKFGTSWSSVAMTDMVTPNTSKFNIDNNYAYSFKLLPTINPGKYQVVLTIKATSKVARRAELKSEREFKVNLIVNVVAPKFQISYKGGHTLIGSGQDTYHTYSLTDVRVSDLFDVQSTRNISKSTDVNPATAALGYDYYIEEGKPAHGAQGVRFNPYPAITAPVASEWGSAMFVRRDVAAHVKLITGQMIPVNVICTENSEVHSVSILHVQYNRLNLSYVNAVSVGFAGNYNAMITTGIDISNSDRNFTPKSQSGITLDPTMIRSIAYSAQSNVQSASGVLPSGLENRKILQINPTTGVVTSIAGITWENPEAVLFQTFRVEYTDIWGNKAHKDVNVYVKSNGTPVI